MEKLAGLLREEFRMAAERRLRMEELREANRRQWVARAAERQAVVRAEEVVAEDQGVADQAAEDPEAVVEGRHNRRADIPLTAPLRVGSPVRTAPNSEQLQRQIRQ